MNTDREWWEPLPDKESPERWLCDHEGDWCEKADALWDEVMRLRHALATAEAALSRKPVRGD